MNERNRQALALIGAGLGAVMATRAAIRKWREYHFRNKTVLITGGSRGLGLEMARLFAAEGARLVLCARDAEELERARTELEARGADVLTVTCDVTDRGEVDAMLARVRERFGHVDVLINNAGVIQVGPMELMTLDDYESAMKIHFWAPLYLTLAVLPEMRTRKEGRIVNIASIGGKVSVPHLLPYNASKFALVGLSEGLRAELAKDGIVVTTVCPGLMRTGSHRKAYFKGQNETEYTLFSIIDALPIASTGSERAARQVVNACRRGEAELIFPVQAVLAEKVHALFPGLTADLLGIVNRMLPGPGGIGTETRTGEESATPLSRSWLTSSIERAARANNEAG